MNRRNFLGRSARLLMVTGLAATAGYLTLTGRVSLSRSCRGDSDCGRCRQSGNCNESKAKQTKNHGRG